MLVLCECGWQGETFELFHGNCPHCLSSEWQIVDEPEVVYGDFEPTE